VTIVNNRAGLPQPGLEPRPPPIGRAMTAHRAGLHPIPKQSQAPPCARLGLIAAFVCSFPEQTKLRVVAPDVGGRRRRHPGARCYTTRGRGGAAGPSGWPPSSGRSGKVDGATAAEDFLTTTVDARTPSPRPKLALRTRTGKFLAMRVATLAILGGPNFSEASAPRFFHLGATGPLLRRQNYATGMRSMSRSQGRGGGGLHQPPRAVDAFLFAAPPGAPGACYVVRRSPRRYFSRRGRSRIEDETVWRWRGRRKLRRQTTPSPTPRRLELTLRQAADAIISKTVRPGSRSRPTYGGLEQESPGARPRGQAGAAFGIATYIEALRHWSPSVAFCRAARGRARRASTEPCRGAL